MGVLVHVDHFPHVEAGPGEDRAPAGRTVHERDPWTPPHGHRFGQQFIGDSREVPARRVSGIRNGLHQGIGHAKALLDR